MRVQLLGFFIATASVSHAQFTNSPQKPPDQAVQAASFTIATNGDDKNPGTQQQPFATLEGARGAIRNLKKRSGLPPGGVTVWIHGGIYPLL